MHDDRIGLGRIQSCHASFVGRGYNSFIHSLRGNFAGDGIFGRELEANEPVSVLPRGKSGAGLRRAIRNVADKHTRRNCSFSLKTVRQFRSDGFRLNALAQSYGCAAKSAAS